VTGAVSRSVGELSRFGLIWWLPAGGVGNGLDAEGWAPILEVRPDELARILPALAAAGIAGYAAPALPGRRRLSRRRTTETLFRLWVASTRYSAAEDVLRRLFADAKADPGPAAVRPAAPDSRAGRS
jgi:hypothetical protein